MRIIRVTLLTLFLTGNGQAWSSNDEGLAALKTGDYATVLLEWRTLAEQGDGTGQLKLGNYYRAGVEPDYIQAYKCYILANAHGSQHAMKSLGFINSKMTPAQIAEAQKLAREWMEEHPHSRDWMEEWPPRW